MTLNHDDAKEFVLKKFKAAIEEKTGKKVDDDVWAGGAIAEAIASLVDYIVANNSVLVGNNTGKMT